MVSLAAIASATGKEDPDLEAILRYLDESAQPVAIETRPLLVVSGAVHRLHDRVLGLQVDITGKSLTVHQLKSTVTRTFNDVAEYYMILAGISPPSDPVDRIRFEREVEFARKMVQIAFRLYREIGGKSDVKWEAVMPQQGRREAFAAELKALGEAYPLPEFATEERMLRQSRLLANLGWIVFFIFILWQAGILADLLRLLGWLISGEPYDR